MKMAILSAHCPSLQVINVRSDGLDQLTFSFIGGFFYHLIGISFWEYGIFFWIVLGVGNIFLDISGGREYFSRSF